MGAVYSVGEKLGFKAKPAVLIVDCSCFSLDIIKEIAGVKLQPGQGGFKLKRDTGGFIVTERSAAQHSGLPRTASCGRTRRRASEADSPD